jgi:hypothetical protein
LSEPKPEEGKEGVSAEELEKLIKEAQDLPYVSKDLKEGKLCVQWGRRKIKCVPYDPKLEEHLRSLADEVRSMMKGRAAGTSFISTSDISIWSTSVKGRRPLVEHLVEKLTWLQKVFTDVGTEAFLAILMSSGVQPDKIEEFVYKFKSDPDALTSFIVNKLENFIVAASSQQDLVKCRNDVVERDAYIAYLESQIENAYNEYSSLYNKYVGLLKRYRMVMDFLRIAVMMMPKDRLKAYTEIVSTLVYEYGFEPRAGPGVSGS